jgi:hypothetical protein
MARAREPRHVDADLGEDGLTGDARNCADEVVLVREGREDLRDLPGGW